MRSAIIAFALATMAIPSVADEVNECSKLSQISQLADHLACLGKDNAKLRQRISDAEQENGNLRRDLTSLIAEVEKLKASTGNVVRYDDIVRIQNKRNPGTVVCLRNNYSGHNNNGPAFFSPCGADGGNRLIIVPSAAVQ